MKTGSFLSMGAAALIGFWACSAAGAAGRDFTLPDLRHIVSLSDPQVSPDGREIAVVVTTPDWNTDKAAHEIDLIDIASGARRPLTRYRADVSSPRWSADGKRLAFITLDTTPAAPKPAVGKSPAAADANEKYNQVFVLPMDGGDAQRVTDANRDVVSFAWSPDGKTIAYVAADAPVNEKAIKAHDDAFKVTENNFLVRAALTPSHLWVVPSTGGTAKRLTQGQFSLETDQQDSAAEPAWSPDGRTITFSRFPDPYWALSYKSSHRHCRGNRWSCFHPRRASGCDDTQLCAFGGRLRILNCANVSWIGSSAGSPSATKLCAGKSPCSAAIPSSRSIRLLGSAVLMNITFLPSAPEDE